MRSKAILLAALGGGLMLSGTGYLTAYAAKTIPIGDSTQVVTVAFKPTDETALSQYAYDTVTPGTADFHQYLTPDQVAAKFGQPTTYVNDFKSYMQKYDIKTDVYPGNLAVKLTGTVGHVDKAFKAVATSKGGTKFTLPASLSDQVVSVIGVYAVGADSKKKVSKSPSKKPVRKPGSKKAAKSTKAVNAAASQSTAAGSLTTTADRPNTTLAPDNFSKQYGALKFADRYHLDDLYAKGLQGAGQRIGVIAGSDLRDSDLQTYWQTSGIADNLSRIHRFYSIDDQKTSQKALDAWLSDPQMESTLDVQEASAVAPEADIDLYVGNSDDNTSSVYTAFYSAFMQAVSANRDKQLTTSFAPGSETASKWNDDSSTPANYNHAFNIMLEQAAVQGISVFEASGDSGPSEDNNGKLSNTVSTSPYQVMVGGTTLPYTQILHNDVITVPRERAWGDTYSLSKSDLERGEFSGSGGGFSTLNATPQYQFGVPGINTFRALTLLKFRNGTYTLNPNPKVITGTASGRNFPDVSGNADLATGYATFYSGYPSSSGGRKYQKIWLMGGGTSYVAPQMAAANAVMNSGRQTPTGFWNPQIYKFAQESDSPFNVLDDAENNNNLYYTGQPGKLYNQATGLGTVNFAKLSEKFDGVGK